MLKTIEEIKNAPIYVSKFDAKATAKKLSKAEMKEAVVNYHEPTESIETARTGEFTATLATLATDIEKWSGDTVSIHADPKKNKLMVRRGSHVLFKVFIQKGGYKIHLKHKDDFKLFGIEAEPAYQNGFNLPWMIKGATANTLKTIAEKC